MQKEKLKLSIRKELERLVKESSKLIDVQLEEIDPGLKKFKNLETDSKVDLLNNTHTPLGNARTVLDILYTDFSSIKLPSSSMKLNLIGAALQLISDRAEQVSDNQDKVMDAESKAGVQTTIGHKLAPTFKSYSDSCNMYLNDVMTFAHILYPEKFPKEQKPLENE